MRKILLMLMVMAVGCGANAPGPHDNVMCGSGWDAFLSPKDLTAGCERQCEEPPTNYGVDTNPPLPKCTVDNPYATAGMVDMRAYFTSNGLTGACVVNVPSPIVFAECEAQ